eukprot:3939003-Amphidinium_carterae.1
MSNAIWIVRSSSGLRLYVRPSKDTTQKAMNRQGHRVSCSQHRGDWIMVVVDCDVTSELTVTQTQEPNRPRRQGPS